MKKYEYEEVSINRCDGSAYIEGLNSEGWKIVVYLSHKYIDGHHSGERENFIFMREVDE